MRGLVKAGPGARRLELREVPEPRPQAGEVVVRVAGCGICGTDVSIYEGTLQHSGDAAANFPMVIGHEFTGMVVAVGAEVSDLREGDWVVVNPHLYCGSCRACRRGEQEICEQRPLLSWDLPGGAAELVAVRAGNAYRLPAAVAARVGVLAEPLAVAVHALRRLAPSEGERLTVVGSGPIGILTGFVARRLGVDVTLIGLELDAARLAAAAALGVRTLVADGGVPGFVGEADLVVEAAGTATAVADAIAHARKGGRIGLLGLPHAPVPLDLPKLVFGEKSLWGIRGYAPADWDETVALLGDYAEELGALVTHAYDLGDFASAMETVESRRAVKVVLRPDGDWHDRIIGSK